MDSNQSKQLLMVVMVTLATNMVLSADLPLSDYYKLTCGSDVEIKISYLVMKEVGYETSSSDVMSLKDEGVECMAGQSEKFFNWKLTGDQVYNCASKFGNEGQTLQFTYTAKIFATSTTDISRSQLATYTFTCIYKKEQLLSFSSYIQTQIKGMVQAAMTRKTGQKAPISLKSTTDGTFATTSTQTEFKVGDKIFVSSDILIQPTADVVVQITECVAAAPSPHQTTQVSLIDKGCSKVPEMVELIQNYAGVSAGFSIKAFFWESFQTSDTTQFTLTCKLKLCANSNSANQCTKRDCNGGGRRKRSIGEEEENGDVYIANLGPFTVRANDDGAAEGRCNLAQSGCSHECAVDMQRMRWICLCPSSAYILAGDAKTCFKSAEAKMETVSIGSEGWNVEKILLVFIFVSLLLGGLGFIAYLLKRRLGAVSVKEKTHVDDVQLIGSC